MAMLFTRVLERFSSIAQSTIKGDCLRPAIRYFATHCDGKRDFLPLSQRK